MPRPHSSLVAIEPTLDSKPFFSFLVVSIGNKDIDIDRLHLYSAHISRAGLKPLEAAQKQKRISQRQGTQDMVRAMTSVHSYAYNAATLLIIMEDQEYLRETLASTRSLEHEHVRTLHYGIPQLLSAQAENEEEMGLWRAALEIKCPQRKHREKLQKKRPFACVYDTVSSAAEHMISNRSASILYTTQLTRIDSKEKETRKREKEKHNNQPAKDIRTSPRSIDSSSLVARLSGK